MTTATIDTASGRRLSLSQIVEILLTRGNTERSSVTLTRNAKGVTQIEVTVRTGDTPEVATAADAVKVASSLYTDLRAAYPLPDGYVGAEGHMTATQALAAAREDGGGNG